MSKAPPNEDFLRLNDRELYEECDRRREAQNSAHGCFKLAFNDMLAVFHYQQLARDAYCESFRDECEEQAQRYLLSAQDKDFPGRLNWCIQATENLLDVLNEMKRRI